MRKVFYLLVVIIGINACNNPNESSGGQINNEEDMLVYGKKVYESQCRLCHGENGNSGIGGAADLRNTKLDETAIGDLIFHGKGVMPSFKDKLGEPEINAVTKYVLTLRTSK